MLRFILLGLSLCAALLVPHALPDLFKPVDYALNDWRIRMAIEPRPESRIVIVDVDERSLAEQGAWPWPRATIARLLQTLIDDYRVASIAVDMVFPEPRPNDDLLAKQFSRPEMNGAVVFDLETRNLPPLEIDLPPPPPLAVTSDAPLRQGVPVVSNHAGLTPARVGHITPIFDSDGAVRRLPPLLCTKARECRPSLSLTTYAGMIERPRLNLQPGIGWLKPAWELALQASDGTTVATMPLGLDGSLVVPYRHTKRDWTSVSASDILKRRIDPAILKGVIILMGGTALGLSDVIATPLGPVAAGLEPHAEVLSALLDNQFAVVPKWGWILDAALLLPFALLLGWMIGRYEKPLHRAFIFPLWLLLTWGGGAAISLAVLRTDDLLLPLAPLLLFPPLAVLLLLTTELYRTGHERAGILNLLAAYLPRQVAQRLSTSSGGVNATVDASRREITVLFADIHGFAGLSEGRSPEVVARLMQRVFSEMAEAVVNHHGTIDKFIGDAIMAFWNAPDDDPEHARNALAAARDIQRRVNALALFCQDLGMPAISIGIGLETGPALVGNFGPAHRRTFTALGEPVILASRLEGLTKTFNQCILIGENCAAALRLQDKHALGPVQIRGRVQPLTLYKPGP